MEKIKIFEQEIKYIKNSNYIESFKTLINNLPDYFFIIQAASTGKYHPAYTLGNGGLVRHTKAACKIAYELLNNPSIGDKYTSNEKDLMIIGLAIHDGLKSGKVQEKYTKTEHPLLVGQYIEEIKDKLLFNEQEILFLKSVIASHMGIWNKDFDGNEVLPVPKTKYENFVHMCDFLASRKALRFEFDENYNIVE